MNSIFHSRRILSTMRQFAFVTLAVLPIASTVRALDELAATTLLTPLHRSFPTFEVQPSHWRGSIVVSGPNAYVADLSAGLSVYDITASSGPRLLGNYPARGSVTSVRIQYPRALINDSSQGSIVLDIHDLSKPEVLPTEEVAKFLREFGYQPEERKPPCLIAIVENRAYISREDIGVVTLELHGSNVEAPQPAELTKFIGFSPHPPFNSNAKPTDSIQSENRTMDMSLDALIHTAINPEPALSLPLLSRPLPQVDLQVRVDAQVFVLTVFGPIGKKCMIETTSDLNATWIQWQSLTLSPEGTEILVEQDNRKTLFFRAVDRENY